MGAWRVLVEYVIELANQDADKTSLIVKLLYDALCTIHSTVDGEKVMVSAFCFSLRFSSGFTCMFPLGCNVPCSVVL